jgi:hypothetical protein
MCNVNNTMILMKTTSTFEKRFDIDVGRINHPLQFIYEKQISIPFQSTKYTLFTE